jgi:hypothetical protein
MAGSSSTSRYAGSELLWAVEPNRVLVAEAAHLCVARSTAGMTRPPKEALGG